MMNMSCKVGGLAYRLRFKTKTRREVASVIVTQHICESFFSSFFFLTQQPNGGVVIFPLKTN